MEPFDMRKMTPEEVARFRPLVESVRTAFLWGSERSVSPRLVPYVWGDGAQWVRLEPLDTRPEYYVLRGDSRWSPENQGCGVQPREWLVEVEEALADEYGYSDADADDEPEPYGWPAYSPDSGVAWGPYEMPDDETEAR